MKEIIEYILAALIIVSVIPIITYVENTVYSPRPRPVEPIVQAVFTNKLFNIINNIFSSGNLTLFQSSLFNALIAQQLSAYSDYGYNITIRSYAIKIDAVSYTINVTTMYKGTVSLLVVSTDLSIATKNTPRQIIPLPNNTYEYVFENPIHKPKSIALVVAVLDIGTAKFIDYKIVSNDMKQLSLININGQVYLVAPTTLTTALATAPGQAIICYYDPTTQNFYTYGHRNYKYVSSSSMYKQPHINSTFTGIFNRTIIYTNYTNIWYNVSYAGSINLHGSPYNMFKLYSYINETNGYFQGKYNFTGTLVTNTATVTTTLVVRTVTKTILLPTFTTITYTTSLPVQANVTVYYAKITSTTLRYSSTTSYPLGSNTATYAIYYPLLNAVAIIVKDSSGNLYVALPYFNYLTAGSTIPKNWPVSREAYWYTVGMFSYYVEISVWRKSI